MTRLVIRPSWKEWRERVKQQRATLRKIKQNPWNHNERWVHNTTAHHQDVLSAMLNSEPRKHYTQRELDLMSHDA